MVRIVLDELFAEAEETVGQREILRVTSAVPLKLELIATGQKDLTVLADVLTLDGPLSAPGRNIKVSCRELRCGPAASIDVSGPPITTGFKRGDKKPTSMTPGDPGAKGDPGQAGAPAGSIEILAGTIKGSLRLLANGGSGGRAQDGGDGAVGGVGPDAPPTPCRTTGDNRGLQGGRGLKGGAAGEANLPGAGGAGGAITVKARSAADSVIGECRGGEPGEVAEHGKPGDGGPGGSGGPDLIGQMVQIPNYLARAPILPLAHLTAGAADLGPLGIASPASFDPHFARYEAPEHAASHMLEFHEPHHEPHQSALRCEANGWHSLGPTGDRGPAGDSQTAAIPTNVKGADGSLTVTLDKSGTVLYYADSVYLRFLQLAAEENYRSGDIDAAVISLKFLADITDKSALEDCNLTRMFRELKPLDQTFINYVSLCNARANALLAQMSFGLDYYGRARNYVPLLNLKGFDSAINSLLECGAAIESDLKDYKAQQSHENAQRLALRGIIDQVSVYEQRGEGEYDALTSEIKSLDAQISALVLTAEIQKQEISGAQQRLKDAISSVGAGCGFGELITIVGVAVAMGTGAYAAVGALQTALSAYEAANTFSESLEAIKKLEPVGKDIKEAADAWAKIKDIVSQSPEAAKLAFLEKDYDQHMADAMSALDKVHLPEAGDLKRKLQEFSEINKTKNTKALELTNRLLRRQQLKAELEQRKIDANQARDALAETIDPTLPIMLSFSQGAYREIRSAAAELILLENRAYEYWSLTERDAPLRGWTIDALRVAHSLVQSDTVGLRSRRASGPGQMHRWETVDLKAITARTMFTRFLAGTPVNEGGVADHVHQLTFSLTPENAPQIWRWPAIGITGLRVRLGGTTSTDGMLQYALVHSGSVIVCSPDQQKHRFIHDSRIYRLAYDIRSGVEAAGEQVASEVDSLAVSPFATWTLIIKRSSNSGLSLSKVADAQFSLIGNYMS
jgi:hypothetical protein